MWTLKDTRHLLHKLTVHLVGKDAVSWTFKSLHITPYFNNIVITTFFRFVFTAIKKFQEIKMYGSFVDVERDELPTMVKYGTGPVNCLW